MKCLWVYIFILCHTSCSGKRQSAFDIGNAYCPLPFFRKQLNNLDSNGALPEPHQYFTEVINDLQKYPCHNFAYTSTSEQWDGIRKSARKLDALNKAHCYFSCKVCNRNRDETIRSVHRNLEVSIFVPSYVPYVKKLFSEMQLGNCPVKCKYEFPKLSYKAKLLSRHCTFWEKMAQRYDAFLFPLDWSYGKLSGKIPYNSSCGGKSKSVKRNIWIGFSEEDILDPFGGRPDIWSNRRLLQSLDFISTYDSDSADIPFNLYRFHIWGACSINMYFRGITATSFVASTTAVSYISRNCREKRDRVVRDLMSYVEIACFGKCLNNRPWPFEKGSYPYWQEKVIVLKKFKFTLAFQGYFHGALISEKLYDAFIAGTVPIFSGIGRKVVEQYAPSPNSFIHVDDYYSIAQLARAIKVYHANDSMYDELHRWRMEAPRAHFCRLLNSNINSLACQICRSVSIKTNYDIKEDRGSRALSTNLNLTTEVASISFLSRKPPGIGPIKKTPVGIMLVMLVKSPSRNIEQRKFIRHTWGKTTGKHDRIIIRFLLTNESGNGNVTSKKCNNADMLLSGQHSYTPYVTLWGMEQIIKQVGTFAFLYVITDDIIVDIHSLTEKLEEYSTQKSVFIGPTLNKETNARSLRTHADQYILSYSNANYLVKNRKYFKNKSGHIFESLSIGVWLRTKQVYMENRDFFGEVSLVEDSSICQIMNSTSQLLSLAGLEDEKEKNVVYTFFHERKVVLSGVCRSRGNHFSLVYVTREV
jgi:hypothetical protein